MLVKLQQQNVYFITLVKFIKLVKHMMVLVKWTEWFKNKKEELPLPQLLLLLIEKVKELNKAGSSANTIYARVKAEIKKED